ncbi:MAG: hypothetical protein WBA51_08165 [Erythrobacter sp.]
MRARAALTLVFALGVSACGANEPAEPVQTGEAFIRNTVAKACNIEPAALQLSCSDEEFLEFESAADMYGQTCSYGFIEGATNPYSLRAISNSNHREWGYTGAGMFSVVCADGKPRSPSSPSGKAIADRPNADTLNAELAPTATNGNPAPTVTAMQCSPMTHEVYEYCCDVTFDNDEAFRASDNERFQTVAYYRSPIDNSWVSKIANPQCGASNVSNQQQIIPLN